MTRLIVVTLLLAAVAIFLKLRNRTNTTTRAIKVTSRVTISRGSMIAVVEIDGRRLLIGAAPNQVNLITELAETAPTDPMAPPVSNPAPGAASAAIARLTSTIRPGAPRDSSTNRQDAPAPRRSTSTAPIASSSPLPSAPDQNGSTNLVDRVRRMTARTVEPKLRLPHQPGGTT
ncbi:MAG: hypothetical protein JWN62_29 [Acidimicrobiales bacterium]|nr:hypothetical protein [Acidimicrobiales bacterium]